MKVSLNCWQHICTFCEAKELLALSATCKAIKRLTDREELWERLVMRAVQPESFVMMAVDFSARPQWKLAVVGLVNEEFTQKCVEQDMFIELDATCDPGRSWTCFVSGRHVLESTALLLPEMRLTVQGVGKAALLTQGVALFSSFGARLAVRGMHLEKLPSRAPGMSALCELGKDAHLTLDRCTLQGVPGERLGSAIVMVGGVEVQNEPERRFAQPVLDTRLVVTGCSFVGFGDKAIFVTRLERDLAGGVSGVLRDCCFRDVGTALNQDCVGDWTMTDCVFEGVRRRCMAFMELRSISISKCRFENMADSCEGGVFCYDTAALQMSDTVLSKVGPAGLYLANVRDCILSRVEISNSNEALCFVGQTETVYESESEEDAQSDEGIVMPMDLEAPGEIADEDHELPEAAAAAAAAAEEEELVEDEVGLLMEYGQELRRLPPLEYRNVVMCDRQAPLRLLCEEVQVKAGHINIQTHGVCVFNDCVVSASTIGLKAESSFVGRLTLQLTRCRFERANLLMSGGCDATLFKVVLESGRATAVSNCRLICENVTGPVVLLRRLNADKGVAPLELRGDENRVQVTEEPEMYPTVRKEEYATLAEFCDAFMRESRRLKCCTKVFTGVNHFNQPLFECHSCGKNTTLCWFCAAEHQGMMHNTTTTTVGDCGFCDCHCLDFAKK